MVGTQAQHFEDNFNIDTYIIHNLSYLLYSNVNRSCFGHPSCDLSQDKQLLGLSFELIYHGITLGMSTTRSIPLLQ